MKAQRRGDKIISHLPPPVLWCEFKGAIVSHYSHGRKKRASNFEIDQVLKSTAVSVRGGSEPSEFLLRCAFSRDAAARKMIFKQIRYGKYTA